MRQVIGFAMLSGGFAFLMWRAHKEGALRYLLQGALYGGGISVFMYVEMSLIFGGPQQ